MIGKTNAKLILQEVYNYGDGSLNTVQAGYNGHIALNGNADVYQVATRHGTGNYYMLYYSPSTVTNINQVGFSAFFEQEIWNQYDGTNAACRAVSPVKDKVTVLNQHDGPAYSNKAKGLISSGLNTKTFITPIIGNKTVDLSFAWGNLSGSLTISGLKFLCDGAYLTLAQMVEQKVIKPLVLISNNNQSSYNCPALNNYTGGTCGGSFAHFIIIFMTNDNANITGMQFTSSKAASSGDGWLCGMTNIDNFRITYVDEEETPL